MQDCRFGLIVPALLWMTIIATPGAHAVSNDYTVHVAAPTITDHFILQDGPLPPICRETTTIELRACRGEYEPASFVITDGSRLSAASKLGMLFGERVNGAWQGRLSGYEVLRLLSVESESVLDRISNYIPDRLLPWG